MKSQVIETSIRLISAAYIDEPAVSPLTDSDDEIDILNRLEAETSSRLAMPMIPSGVDPAELLNVAYGYGYSYINAAFCYARAPGNRFNGADRGAWYAATGSRAKETSQAEVIFHRTRALKEAGCLQDIGHYRELLASFVCPFHELMSNPTHPALDPDTSKAYPVGQALAKTLIANGSNGLLYPSARHPGGECLAVFRPSVIQNVRQGDAVTFEWTGEECPRIL